MPVKICVCRTIWGELPGDELIKVAEHKPRLEIVTQRDNLVSSQVGRSCVSLKSHTNNDAEVSAGAFYPPQQIGFVFRSNSAGWSVLAWYMADTEDLTGVDADQNGADNGVARKTV